MQAKTVTKKILLDQKNNNQVISRSYNCQFPSSMLMKKVRLLFFYTIFLPRFADLDVLIECISTTSHSFQTILLLEYRSTLNS